MSLITRNAKEYRSVTAQLMSQNLPIVNYSFGIFLFYVILTISYLRAQTIETSSLPTDSSTVSRGDVFVVRTRVYFSRYLPNGELARRLLERQKPSKTSEKWVILITLQFRYTFYRPQTKRLRARKIGLQYKVRASVAPLACVQTSPISFVARGKGTSA